MSAIPVEQVPGEETSCSELENSIKYMTPTTRNEQLLDAATSGDLESVILILKHGGDIQTTDSGGNTPLHRACWKGRQNVLEYLIEKRAAVEAGTLMGNTPLHRAAYNGHTGAVRALLDNDAHLESRCRYGHTAMFAAAHYGHLTTLEYLVSRDCNLDARNDLGQTALHVVAHKCQNNAEEIIDCLLEAGVLIEAAEDQGYTAMHSAAYFGRMDCVAYLIKKGGDMEAEGHHGFTPLLSATLGIRHDIIEMLLKLGANWTVESTGPERILDVLYRAKKSDGYKNNQAEWQQCYDLLSRWTNSSQEELVMQYMFKKLLSIPGNRMTQCSGWMVGENEYMEFEMCDFLHINQKCQQIGEHLAVVHAPHQRTYATTGTQTSPPRPKPQDATMKPSTELPHDTAATPSLLNRENSSPRDTRSPSPPPMNEATGRDERHDIPSTREDDNLNKENERQTENGTPIPRTHKRPRLLDTRLGSATKRRKLSPIAHKKMW